jgi:hypothetical protein
VDISQIVEELWAREQIRDCLFRYSRGIDRYDVDLVRSCYHPDAVDEHGVYNGDLSGFVGLVHRFRGPESEYGLMQHVITNTLIERDGDVAHVESYLYNPLVGRDPAAGLPDILVGGRFIDRFERRAGRWAIAHRRLVCDYCRMAAPTAKMWEDWAGATVLFGTADAADPLYDSVPR